MAFDGRVLSKIDVLSLLPARQYVLRDHRAVDIKKTRFGHFKKTGSNRFEIGSIY